MVRLQETVDDQGAKVAEALVEMIVRDVESTKRQKYGATAKQIVSKIEQDSSVVGVIDHFVKGISSLECERLLATLLPEKYFEWLAKADNAIGLVDSTIAQEQLVTLATCFRRAFEVAPDEVKRKVSRNFVRIIREEGKSKVLAYEAHLFSADDLQYLALDDMRLVKQHLLQRLKAESDVKLEVFLRLVQGIGNHIEKSDASEFTDIVMQELNRHVYTDNKDMFVDQITRENAAMQSSVGAIVANRIQTWIEFFESREQPMEAGIAREIHRRLLDTFTPPDDLPF